MNRIIAGALWLLVALLLLFSIVALSRQAMDIKPWLLAVFDIVLLVMAAWFICRHPQWRWLGVLMFALTWLIFPLLKPLNSELIHWHADDLLMCLDAMLWGGQTLPAYFHFEDHPLLADVVSACYFSFYFIVVGSVLYCAWRQNRIFFNALLSIYLLGFIGYITLPAAGAAFYSLPHEAEAGGAITQWVTAIVRDGVTGMDVFPSLHSALSVFVVGFLWCDGKRFAALLLVPLALGIVAATIILRYHYGIDVLAGLLLAGIALYFSHKELHHAAGVYR